MNVSSQLTNVRNNFSKTVREGDNGAKLKSATLVKVFIKKARGAWDKLYPSIEILMDNAYIDFQGDKDFAEFKKEMKNAPATA